MDISTIFATTSSAITLAEKFAEMMKQANSHGANSNLFEMLSKLKQSAINMCYEFNHELSEMNSDFFSSGIDVNMSLNQLNEDLTWYNFLTKSKISRYEKKFKSIYERLSGFIDDSASVAICCGSKEPLEGAFKMASERNKQLANILNPDVPLYEIFQEMLNIVREITEKLQGDDNLRPNPNSVPQPEPA